MIGFVIIFLTFIYQYLLKKKTNEAIYELILEDQQESGEQKGFLREIKIIESENVSKYTVNELIYERVIKDFLKQNPNIDGKWAVISSKQKHKVGVYETYSVALDNSGNYPNYKINN